MLSPSRGEQEAAAGPIPFFVSFPRNPDFVGRSNDLETLHAALRKREPVGIRPAGLTGMGGIGKTQLAVEYAYRHKGDYPGGIFWVNTAEPLEQGLARVGPRLRPEIRGEPPDRQLQVAFEELSRRPDALLIFDNLEDPAQLTLPVGSEPSPLTLNCHILFTTRQRDLGPFRPIELSVLPEDPALRMLLRHDSRHAVRDDPDHPDRPEAKTICRLLGWLPLALELAGAFLGKRTTVPLAAYRQRLQAEGCLSTLDSEVKHLPRIYLPRVHKAAMAATLKSQWDVLTQDRDEQAQLVLRVAGQFPKATTILTRTLGLFAGVSGIAPSGHVPPLVDALDRLHDVRLVEELHADRIRLHPLIGEFASTLTPPSETRVFRHDCALLVARKFEDLASLEDITQADGVDAVQQTLMIALNFIDWGRNDPAAKTLNTMLRVFQRESHHLREWDSVQQPNYLAQQVLIRAVCLGTTHLATRAEARLRELAQPAIVARWRTFRESPALVRILTGHQSSVRAVAVAADGRQVVSASDDGTVAVWDLTTGQRLRELRGHRAAVNAVAVSPGGRQVVSGSDDGTVAVWDLATGRRLRELRGHQAAVRAVAVALHGRQVVSGCDDGTVVVWDLTTGRRLRQLRGHPDAVNAVAVDAGGRYAVSGSRDRTVAVWDLATGRVRELRGHQAAVRAVALVLEGQQVVSGCDDGTVAVWDPATGRRLRELRGHRDAVNAVAVDPGGRHAVSGSDNGTVAVWDLTTDERARELRGHQAAVRAVAVAPGGRRVVSGCDDGTVAVWDLATGRQLRELRGHQAVVRAVAVTADGRQVVFGCDDGTAAVWDLAAGRRLRKIKLHRTASTAVAVAPDGLLAVSGSRDGTVAFWNPPTGRRLRELGGHEAAVRAVAVAPGGRHAVSGSDDGTVAFWDLTTGRRLRVLKEHKAAVRSVVVSPDGRHAVSGSLDGTAAFWDLANGKWLGELGEHQAAVNAVAVAPDGRLAIYGSDNGTVAVRDLRDGKPLTFSSLDGSVRCVTWGPDSRSLIVGDDDGNVYGFEYREL